MVNQIYGQLDLWSMKFIDTYDGLVLIKFTKEDTDSRNKLYYAYNIHLLAQIEINS